MGSRFNADEIFEMAEQIERNGASFYRQASSHAADPEIRTLFSQLASMEENHLRIFGEMRARYAQDRGLVVPYDPDNEASQYLQSIASSHGWEGKPEPDREWDAEATIEQIFWAALAAEKNSVVFYSGLRVLVSISERDPLDAIIREELGHITQIHKALESFQG